MFYMWVSMAVEFLSDDEIYQITGIYIPELKIKETKKLIMEYKLEELPEDTQQKVMMLIIKEVDDVFNLKDFKYDMKMKVGTDGLKDIKINQINMLMQQAGNLTQAGVVPASILGLLMADMAEAMDRPDIAKMIKTYQPEPDPMQQAMAEAELKGKEASTAKDEALAKNALARTQREQVVATKEAASIDADVAKKYADVAKTTSDIEQGRVSTAADAYSKVKQANAPKGGTSGSR
jgi:hypothetical protein